jgi:hypothetical protein
MNKVIFFSIFYGLIFSFNDCKAQGKYNNNWVTGSGDYFYKIDFNVSPPNVVVIKPSSFIIALLNHSTIYARVPSYTTAPSVLLKMVIS